MKNKSIPKLVTILIPILSLLFYVTRNYFLTLLPFIPLCPFYSIFHLYCPACGNTRSVLALLRGDFLSSLRYNIIPILLIVLLTLAYIELVCYSFGKHKPILPRKLSFYLEGIALLCLYLVIRNFIPYLTP